MLYLVFINQQQHQPIKMEFKIDTKDSFTIIKPLYGAINAKMTEDLGKKCGEIRQSGSKNLIIDLGGCDDIDTSVVNDLVILHEESYSTDQSIVFTCLNEKVMAGIKKNETDLLINIAPRMEEAIDIISMEILERDLLSEE